MISAASSVAPAEQWRRNLAQILFDQEQVALRIVFTCAPGDLHAAQGYVAPEDAGERFKRVFLDDVLDRIDRNGLGRALAREIGCEAYAPLEGHAGYQALLAESFWRRLLAPFGARGLLNAFLVDGNREILGWIGIGTRKPSREALAALGPQLSEIAREASRTLQATLDLAAGCGARVPSAVTPQIASLTKREAQIARLVANGCSDLNIALNLGISENTVGSHLRRIYAKLGVHSRAEIVALVCGHGVSAEPRAGSNL